MTPAQLTELTAVNREVNAIPYQGAVGPREPFDYWHDEPEPGMSYVCRDYTQTKADRLKARGWPPEALTVVLCWVETGEYHAVLAVDVDGEAWILDNRYDDPYLMTSPPAGYRWDRRQIAGTTQFQPVT